MPRKSGRSFTKSKPSKKRSRKKRDGPKMSRRSTLNVYEEEEHEEDMTRYDVDNISSIDQYQLPKDFVDEEIDDDMAFTAEDYAKYGDVGSNGLASGKGGDMYDNEYSEEEEDDDDDYEKDGFQAGEPGTMSLLDMFEMNEKEAEVKKKKEQKKQKKRSKYADDSDDDDDDDDDDSSSRNGKSRPTKKMKYSHANGDDDDDDDEDDDEDEDEDGASDSEEDWDATAKALMSSDEDSDDNDDDDDAERKRSTMLGVVDRLGEMDARNKEKRDKQKRRNKLQELDEELPEDEFNVGSFNLFGGSGDGDENQTGSLNIGDLMGELEGSTQLSKLKKQLSTIRNSRATKQVDEPLPEVHAEKITRRIAYTETKKDVSKWQTVVQRNNDKQHLQFPLKQPGKINLSNAELAVKFKPSNSLESDLESLLSSYGYKEDSLKEKEERQLKAREYTPAEVEKREEQLKKMRSLMFHHEIRNKRVKKIKSKSYRKMKRKQRERLGLDGELTLDELRELDPEEARKRQEKQEYARVKERMSLAHKNTSKWAKKQLHRHANDPRSSTDDARKALQRQHEIGQELRRKIDKMDAGDMYGTGDDEGAGRGAEGDEHLNDLMSEDSDSDSDSLDEEGADGEKSKARKMREKLRALETETSAVPSKGLFSLKFMQKGLEKRKEKMKEEMRDFDRQQREELLQLNGGEIDEDLKAAYMHAGEEEEGSEGSDAEDGQEGGDRVGRGVGKRKKDSKKKTAGGAGKDADKEPVILRNTLQSDKVGLSAGSKARVKNPISISMDDIDTEGLVQQNKLQAAKDSQRQSKSKSKSESKSKSGGDGFEVPSFSDDEDSDSDADADDDATNRLLANLKKVSTVKSKVKVAGIEVGSHQGQEEEEAGSSSRQGRGQRKGKTRKQQTAGDSDGGSDDESEEEEEAEQNPWAVGVAANPRKLNREAISKKKNRTQDSDSDSESESDSDSEEESGDGQKKKGKKKKSKSNKARLDVSDTLLLKEKKRTRFEGEDDTDDSGDDGFQLLDGGDDNSEQAKLVKEAFMLGGGEKEAFEKEKKGEVEATLPVWEDSRVPGWGDWGGDGAKQKKKSKARLAHEKKSKMLLEKKAKAMLNRRKDAKLEHVIITEKKDKKAMKYMVTKLPYPYTSVAQYERAMRNPLGPDWNTLRAHQEINKPRVLIKQGNIIEPIHYPEEMIGRMKDHQKQKREAKKSRRKGLK